MNPTATKIETYKGFEVVIDEQGTFLGKDGGNQVASAKTLEGIHDKLNAIVKKSLGQEILLKRHQYGDEGLRFVVAKLVSVREDKKRRGNVEYTWTVEFTDEGGQKRKDTTYGHALVKNTPENVARVERMKALDAEKQRVEKEYNDADESLELYTEKELLGLE